MRIKDVVTMKPPSHCSHGSDIERSYEVTVAVDWLHDVHVEDLAHVLQSLVQAFRAYITFMPQRMIHC